LCNTLYIPARRIKGLLRESALEISEMNLPQKFETKDINNLFGTPVKEGRVKTKNLKIDDYKKVKEWFKWAFADRNLNISINLTSILDVLTEERHQTTIDDEKEIAKEHSLRTIRVLKPKIANREISFKGYLIVDDITERDEQLLSYACMNLRHIGSKRNRGYGLVRCSLLNADIDLTEKYRNNLLEKPGA
jgi:CRISPR-associated protein Csx10